VKSSNEDYTILGMDEYEERERQMEKYKKEQEANDTLQQHGKVQKP